jgi:hypothetical protein
MAGQNKGELSEAYTLLKIIHDRFIKYADSKGLPTDEYIGVTTIDLEDKELKISLEKSTIDFYINESHHSVLISDFISEDDLRNIIKDIIGISGTSLSPTLNLKKNALGINKFKADSYKKSDLSMSFTSFPSNESHYKQGTSIKSFFGGNPTLLNASKATNFTYIIENISKFNLDYICLKTQEFDDKGKLKIFIKDRIKSIYEHGGKLRFSHCDNSKYAASLKFVDSRMDEILADALIDYYSKKITKLIDYKGSIISTLATQNRLKDFIRYTMFGIFPSREWNGTCSANGVILVKDLSGQIVFFHITKEDTLKEYFLSKSYFETASLGRNKFGTVYYENSIPHIKLNLQIRLLP